MGLLRMPPDDSVEGKVERQALKPRDFDRASQPGHEV